MSFTRKTSSYFAAVIAGTAVALNVSVARAASCHGGGGGQALAVLGADQQYQLATSSSVRKVTGFFSPYGDFSETGNQADRKNVVFQFGTALRLTEMSQMALTVPVIHNQLGQGPSQAARTGTGLGDLSLESRHLIQDDIQSMPLHPELSAIAGIKVPTGKSVSESRDRYGANVTGDGVWTLAFGLAIAKGTHRFRLSGDAGLEFPLASRSETRFPGARLTTSESLAWLPLRNWSCNAGLKQLWQRRSSESGASIEGTAGRLYTVNAGVTYMDFDPFWSLSLAYETEKPLWRYAANQADFQTVTLTATFTGY